MLREDIKEGLPQWKREGKTWTAVWEVVRERKDVQGRRNSRNKDLQQERKLSVRKRTLCFHVRGLTLVACLFSFPQNQSRVAEAADRRRSERIGLAQKDGLLLTEHRPSQGNTWAGWIVLCTQNSKEKCFLGREWLMEAGAGLQSLAGDFKRTTYLRRNKKLGEEFGV